MTLPQPPATENWFARHKVLTGLGAAIAVTIVIGVAAGGGDKSGGSAVVDSGTEQQDASGGHVTPINQLATDVGHALGHSDRHGVPRVWNVSAGHGKVVVKWAIDDNFTAGMIRTGARLDVIHILKVIERDASLFRSLKAAEVRGTFSMQDQYGNDSEDKVIDLTYSRATLDRINYGSVNPDVIFDLADRGFPYVQPEFR